MAKKRKRKPHPPRRAKRPATRRPSRRPPPKRPARRKLTKPKPSKPKRRKRTPPKAAPSIPRVTTRPTFIRTRVITQYRKAGRIVKRGTKGASRFRMEQQLNERGRVVRTLELLSKSKIIKTIYSGAIETEGMSTMMPSGQAQGGLMEALFRSNVTTQYHGAKLIEVQIKGVDGRGKEHRVKVSIEPTKSRRIHELVLSRIIQAMREAEVRTQYTIEILRAAKAAGPLKYPLSYQKFRTLDPLTQVEIVITIYR